MNGLNILLPDHFKQMIVILWMVILIRGLPLGMSQTPVSTCNNSTTYAKGSAFERNLNTVLDRLVHNTSRIGFNTFSYGRSPNKVYGLLQCRGDISQSDCFTCSQEAITTVRQRCGKAVACRVCLDLCYLRYENYSFFSHLDIQKYILINALNITNPDAIGNVTVSLLDNLAMKALAPANKGFATGSTDYAFFGNVYGLVQCWRDISIGNCKTCLSLAISAVYQHSQRQGARALLGSCTARYEIYPFFNSDGAPSPSAEPPPPLGGLTPPSEGTHASVGEQSPTSRKSSKNLAIVLGAVGASLLALIICVFAI